VLANAYVEGVEHPVLGPVRMSGRPVSFSASTLSPLRAAPRLGEHTGEVLREAGYGPNEIDTLRDQGVVAIDGSER
jgi:crotonobetainyl-CoA:carnitine CoA-transferase CaiB-like acyl-CoA transferase